MSTQSLISEIRANLSSISAALRREKSEDTRQTELAKANLRTYVLMLNGNVGELVEALIDDTIEGL